MANRTSRLLLKPIACSVLVVLAGCGGDARVAPVLGVVTLEGEPVPDASVTFMPKEGGRPAFGITDSDGKFELTTFAAGDGAVIGSHAVAISAVDEQVSDKAEALGEEFGSLSELMQPKPQQKQTWRIPPVYSESGSSGLEFDVKRGERNQADFELSRKP